ncbi:MAG: hypothetical protein COV99_10140 [Bacteroidetes bacterium CG12_big_fil_rev_8_21_14_0_65_60_17]|nr:MAG: hypothetical protein COV99_10140 [Bacteroidetes bacterium CG12_big_fil_rev_8_21_14_0_65_60_17]
MRRIILIPFLFILAFPALAQELTSPRSIIEANLEATGGQEAWEAVQDMHMKANIGIAMAMGEISISLESHSTTSGHIYGLVNLVDGPEGIPAEAVRQEVYVTPDGGWVKSAQGQQDINDMPAAARDGIRNQFTAKPELAYIDMPDSLLSLAGIRDLPDGSRAYEVKINMAGQETTVLYDVETLYQVGQEATTPMGAITMYSSDFRDVGNGLVVSFKQEGDAGDAGSQTVSLESFEINTGITPADIEKMSRPKISVE